MNKKNTWQMALVMEHIISVQLWIIPHVTHGTRISIISTLASNAVAFILC